MSCAAKITRPLGRNAPLHRRIQRLVPSSAHSDRPKQGAMSNLPISLAARSVFAPLVTLCAVVVTALAIPAAASAGRSSADTGQLVALVSLQYSEAGEAASPGRRNHLRVPIDGVVYGVSRTRSERPGWFSQVVIESDPASRGDDQAVFESWKGLLRVARARYGVATDGSKSFPTSLELVRGTATTHSWLLPERRVDLQTRCVSRTARGGRTCSARLLVKQVPVTSPASPARY
jgi:hypothetical protein